MSTNILDIPRVYTGIAEWMACMIYAIQFRHRIPMKWYVPAAGAALGLQCLFLVVTDDWPLYLWIPCMVTAAGMMLGLLLLLCDLDFLSGAYTCVRAFVLAEFAASLEWQIHCFLWPMDDVVWWQSWGLLVLVYAGICLVMVLLERRCNSQGSRLAVTGHELLVAVTMGVCVFAISNLSFYFKRTPFSGQYASEIQNIRTFVDLCGVTMLYAYHLQRERALARREVAAMQRILRDQYTQYRMGRDSIEMINQKYHDLKHQIAALRAEPDTATRNRWLDEMEEDIQAYEAQNKTGNSVLDTLLFSKSLYCRKHSIDLTVVADGTYLDIMDTMDICALFGNALDNAIECELKIPDKSQRMIHLILRQQKQFLLLQVENYCPDPPDFRRGLPSSTKQDTDNHGFGLKSIQHTAKKYGGSATVQAENTWFILKVLIPIPGERIVSG